MTKKKDRRKISKVKAKKTVSRKRLVKKAPVKMAKTKTSKIRKSPPKEKEYNKCLRCDREFASRDALKKHLKMHNQALREIKLLEEGHVPIESKIGLEFKGKNRIIIS